MSPVVMAPPGGAALHELAMRFRAELRRTRPALERPARDYAGALIAVIDAAHRASAELLGELAARLADGEGAGPAAGRGGAGAAGAGVATAADADTARRALFLALEESRRAYADRMLEILAGNAIEATNGRAESLVAGVLEVLETVPDAFPAVLRVEQAAAHFEAAPGESVRVQALKAGKRGLRKLRRNWTRAVPAADLARWHAAAFEEDAVAPFADLRRLRVLAVCGVHRLFRATLQTIEEVRGATFLEAAAHGAPAPAALLEEERPLLDEAAEELRDAIRREARAAVDGLQGAARDAADGFVAALETIGTVARPARSVAERRARTRRDRARTAREEAFAAWDRYERALAGSLAAEAETVRAAAAARVAAGRAAAAARDAVDQHVAAPLRALRNAIGDLAREAGTRHALPPDAPERRGRARRRDPARVRARGRAGRRGRRRLGRDRRAGPRAARLDRDAARRGRRGPRGRAAAARPRSRPADPRRRARRARAPARAGPARRPRRPRPRRAARRRATRPSRRSAPRCAGSARPRPTTSRPPRAAPPRATPRPPRAGSSPASSSAPSPASTRSSPRPTSWRARWPPARSTASTPRPPIWSTRSAAATPSRSTSASSSTPPGAASAARSNVGRRALAAGLAAAGAVARRAGNRAARGWAAARRRLGLAEVEKTEVIESLDQSILDGRITARLPVIYRQLFTLEPLEWGDFLIGRDADLETVRRAFRRWRDGHAAALAVYGEKGSGKTTLLNAARRAALAGVPCTTVRLDRTGPDAFAPRLAEALGAPAATPIDALPDAARAGGRRVVIVEDAHHLLLRTIGGFEPLRAFLALIAATNRNVFWIVTANVYAWRYLGHTLRIQDHFAFEIDTTTLERPAIEQAILARHTVSGYTLRFEPDERLRGSRGYRRLRSDRARQDAARRHFFDQLARIAEGNVFVALFYWLRSIHAVEDHALVFHPPRVIDVGFLDRLPLDTLHTIAAIIQHGGLSPAEHAEVFQWEPSASRLHLSALADSYLIFRDRGGRYGINKVLYRPFVRLLRGRNVF